MKALTRVVSVVVSTLLITGSALVPTTVGATTSTSVPTEQSLISTQSVDIAIDWVAGRLVVESDEPSSSPLAYEVGEDGFIGDTNDLTVPSFGNRTLLLADPVTDPTTDPIVAMLAGPFIEGTDVQLSDGSIEHVVPPAINYIASKHSVTLFWEPGTDASFDVYRDGELVQNASFGNIVALPLPSLDGALYSIRFPSFTGDPATDEVLDVQSNVRVIPPLATDTTDFIDLDWTPTDAEAAGYTAHQTYLSSDAVQDALQATESIYQQYGSVFNTVVPAPTMSRVVHKSFIATKREWAAPCVGKLDHWFDGDNRIHLIDDGRYRTRWYGEFWYSSTSHSPNFDGLNSVLRRFDALSNTYVFVDSKAPNLNWSGGTVRETSTRHKYWMREESTSGYCPSWLDIDGKINNSWVWRNGTARATGEHDWFPSFEVYRLNYSGTSRYGEFMHTGAQVSGACLVDVCPTTVWAFVAPAHAIRTPA